MQSRFQLPDQLGSFNLKEPIGRGPQCEVWRVSRADDAAESALKILDPKLAADGRLADRFQREAKLAQSLDHPNIVRVSEVLTPPAVPLPCFAMDLLAGGSLAQFRPAPTERFSQTIGLLLAVCDALDYVHGRGLVHCDIKPSNVLLDGRGQPYLTDFGMAASPDELAETGAHGGTIHYLSPEQFASLAEGSETAQRVDARSDIYSLGVLMYELFTGQPPFRAANRFALLYQRMTADPTPACEVRPEVPPALSRLIQTALARQPADRFQSAAELAAALEACG